MPYTHHAEAKEERNNPRAITAILLIMGLFFIFIGFKSLYQVASTFYIDSHTAQALIKDGYRNKWPRFKTFTHQLEFKAADGTLVEAEAVSATPLALGSTVDVIYAPHNVKRVYFNNSFLTAASYDFGVLALGLFIAMYGLSRFTQMVKEVTQRNAKAQATPHLEEAASVANTDVAADATPPAIPVTSKTLTLLRVLQNTLILGFFISIISYLMGGAL